MTLAECLTCAEIAAKLGTKDVSNVTPMAIAIEVRSLSLSLSLNL